MTRAAKHNLLICVREEQGQGMGRDEARGGTTTWVQKNGNEQCADTARQW